MTKADLQDLNETLIALLTNLRDQIAVTLDDLGLGSDEDSEDIEDG